MIDNNNRNGNIQASKVVGVRGLVSAVPFWSFVQPGHTLWAELEKAEGEGESLEAWGGNWGPLSHCILLTMHAIHLLARRWQDILSNKTEFCTVLRRRISTAPVPSPSPITELSFQRASCQTVGNEMLDFSATASGIIIRCSRNNCLGRSQLHFILTVKESSIFPFSSYSIVMMEEVIWKPGVFVTHFTL